MSALLYSDFMHNALYGENGYYRRERKRVGKTRHEDFSTSSSFDLYAPLIQISLLTLKDLHGITEPATLVEIGCEKEAELFEDLPLPDGIKRIHSIHWGEPLELNGPCVIFSNELLDAFAVDRLRFEKGAWHILGLDTAEGILDIDMGAAPASYAPYLPAQAPEGTVVELSARLLDYLQNLAQQPWSGLFVAADYGFSWLEALERTQGTLRAYAQQKMFSLKEILARGFQPGEFDLTAHVNWDVVSQVLGNQGLQPKPIMSQEAFLVGYAGRLFPKLSTAARGQLKELIHPAMMGQKFQMLVAHKPSA